MGVPANPDDNAPPTVRSRTKRGLDRAKAHIPGVSRAANSTEGEGLSLQDKLLTRLLQQAIPSGVEDDDGDYDTDRRLPKPTPFSLPVMGNNFRRFNARIGIVFAFQAALIRLLSWTRPTHTWSFIAVYSFVCLNPYLLTVLPLAMVLLCILVPAFLTRHPPPPSTSTLGMTPYYSYGGPALAPATILKPASETSRDFFRNMRDLQNAMGDFATLHDFLVASISPLTNFSDETVSSTIFLLLTLVTAPLLLVAHILPWKLVFFIGGNAALLSSHPTVQNFVAQLLEQETGGKPAGNGDTTISSLKQILGPIANISLDSAPEEREVEIFELQHRSMSPLSASSEWETMLFSPTPYDPLSPSRIAGDRPRGCRFFEDVQVPTGWDWKGKKWELDLECRGWVVERMITGVGFEIPGNGSLGDNGDEQIRGWVWDLPPSETEDFVDENDFRTVAYGDLPELTAANKGKVKAKEDQGRDWDETTQVPRVGEWRRRRWIRVVQRVGIAGTERGVTATTKDISSGPA